MAFSDVSLPAGSFALNGNGHLYVGGSATFDSTDTSKVTAITGGYELKGFTSGSIQISGSATQNQARGVGDGWSQGAPGGRSATMQLSFLRIIGDTAQDGLLAFITANKANWQSKGVTVAYGVNYEDSSVTPAVTKLSGFAGVWVVTDCSIEQSGGGDNDAQAETVTISLSSFSNIIPINSEYTPTT